MADAPTPELPLATEAEATFDSAAAWDADSANAPQESRGNDAPPSVPIAASAPIETPEETELEAAAETPAEPAVEELPRNDQGQFVKKGKGKPRSDPQARVEAATAKEAAAKEEARLAREESAQLKARLAALEHAGRSQPALQHAVSESADPAGVFPTFEQWSARNPGKDWDSYNDERIEWKADIVASRRLQAFQSQQQFNSTLTAHQQRIEAEKEKYPDWDQVIDTGNQALMAGLNARGLMFPAALFQAALFESPRGPAMLRYLAEHPEDAIQLAAQAQNLPVSAAPMLRQVLESKLAPVAAAKPDSALEPPISQAKPPVNRVGGTASATPIDPEDMDFSPEYIRIENERERKARAMGRW